MGEIDEKVDHSKSNESSQTVEEIELSLRNNWVRYDESWSVPKAFKIGPVVYLNGLIKDGTKGHIATLPKGWRPRKQKMFAQCSNGSTTRVDVLADGRIFLFVTQFQSFLSLEGMGQSSILSVGSIVVTQRTSCLYYGVCMVLFV